MGDIVLQAFSDHIPTGQDMNGGGGFQLALA